LEVWGKLDPKAAREYFESVQKDEIAASAASTLGASAADNDPRGTADWAVSLGDRSVRWEALNGAVNTWAQNRPSEAAVFVLSLTAPDEISHNISTLVRHWTATDSERAEGWVAALPLGVGREAAMASLVESLASAAPARAIEWAVGIQNPDQRLQLARQTFESWATGDAARAQAWLESSSARLGTSLTNELKKALNTTP
jgi:hypothetical protein